MQKENKKNIHNNRLQVINQYVENGGNYDNRYDVTILVNGLPLVHVELKRRGVPIKEAFNQINRYQRDSFWAGSGLYEYILMLVAKYHDSNCEDKEILVDIRKAVDSSMQLRSKKDLIENFIATVNTATKVDDDWIKFVTEQKKTDLDTLIAEEKLKPDETRKFVDNSFRDGILKTTGTDVDRILPPVSRFGGGNRAAKKDGIIAKLQAFFDKYFGLV